MKTYSLDGIQLQCQRYASEGYRKAFLQSTDLNDILLEAQSSIESSINELSTSFVENKDIYESLENQLGGIRESLTSLNHILTENLQELKKKESFFTVVIFGRTMAGKSTLTEIFEGKDRKSRGKGGQRTTRIIYEYKKRNLRVLDVPGIGAAPEKGTHEDIDEIKAMNAGKKADLVLYLITDDGPQFVDAEFLAKIMMLGKPVICVTNIKTDISIDQSLNESLVEIEEEFSEEKLNDIKNTLLEYGKLLGQNWDNLPYVNVHLFAAWTAQRCKNSYKEEVLYKASRFENLLEIIKEVIEEKGNFYREKTFIDAVYSPMFDSSKILMDQSNTNRIQSQILQAKIDDLVSWKNMFYYYGQNRFFSVFETIREDLDSEIDDFIESHYSDDQADAEWSLVISEINDRNIKLYENLFKDFENFCLNEISEISRQIEYELDYETEEFTNESIKVKRHPNSRKIVRLLKDGALIVSSVTRLLGKNKISRGFGIAGMTLSIAETGIEGFEKNKNVRETDTRSKLSLLLFNIRERYLEKIQNKFNKDFEYFIAENLDKKITGLKNINDLLKKLYEIQKDLALGINNHLFVLNKECFCAACKVENASIDDSSIVTAARLPGILFVIIYTESNKLFIESIEAVFPLYTEIIKLFNSNTSRNQVISEILGLPFADFNVSILEDNSEIQLSINSEKIYNNRYIDIFPQIFNTNVIVKEVAE